MSNIVEDDTKVNDPVDDVEEYSAPIIETLNNRYTFLLLHILVKRMYLRCHFRSPLLMNK